ncbi:cytochrome c [uncultured Aquitalea sp.]|uniref:c-type cytochrome n=1 Tax=uncultured Aquitalea sp. TaxID=540272 RepID=UPI0026009684|nr:cytochrome c [uncultured Aquitalea sp.]
MKKILLFALLVLAAGQTFAAEPVSARQNVFKQYKKDVGAMGKMAKGDVAYNKDEFARLASHLDELAQQPWQYFTPGTAAGKTAKETDAKPEIWSKPADWQKAVDTHKAETAKLKQVAATGDLSAIKAQFGAVQKTCKACHDAFRKD